jgi:predicted DNA-binding transcriptional regulator AlpA
MPNVKAIERAAQTAAERAVKALVEQYAIPTAEYLTTQQAASYCSLSTEFFEIARSKADGSGPPYVKLARAVRYRRTDLDAWMRKHLKGEAQRRLAGAQNEG